MNPACFPFTISFAALPGMKQSSSYSSKLYSVFVFFSVDSTACLSSVNVAVECALTAARCCSSFASFVVISPCSNIFCG